MPGAGGGGPGGKGLRDAGNRALPAPCAERPAWEAWSSPRESAAWCRTARCRRRRRGRSGEHPRPSNYRTRSADRRRAVGPGRRPASGDQPPAQPCPCPRTSPCPCPSPAGTRTPGNPPRAKARAPRVEARPSDGGWCGSNGSRTGEHLRGREGSCGGSGRNRFDRPRILRSSCRGVPSRIRQDEGIP